MKIPTRKQVAEAIAEKGYNVDVDLFCDYYEDCGWTVPDKKCKNARKDMVSWRGSLHTWHKNNSGSTSFSAVKQRDEAYKSSKAVYMKPVKAKPAKTNPEIKKLNKELGEIAHNLRNMTGLERCFARTKMVVIARKIHVIKDNGIKLGEILG